MDPIVRTERPDLSIAAPCMHLTEVEDVHDVVSATASNRAAVTVGAVLPKLRPMRVRDNPPACTVLGAYAAVSTAASNVKAKLELPADAAAQR